MSKITSKEVQKTANLARIKLDSKEQEKFAKELNGVLDYFQDIQEVETEDIEKTDHYNLNHNQLRKDEIIERGEDIKEGIRNIFPEREDDSLKVETVIKK